LWHSRDSAKREGTNVVQSNSCAATYGSWISLYDGATWLIKFICSLTLETSSYNFMSMYHDSKPHSFGGKGHNSIVRTLLVDLDIDHLVLSSNAWEVYAWECKLRADPSRLQRSLEHQPVQPPSVKPLQMISHNLNSSLWQITSMNWRAIMGLRVGSPRCVCISVLSTSPLEERSMYLT
jgi:hypothetical protein